MEFIKSFQDYTAGKHIFFLVTHLHPFLGFLAVLVPGLMEVCASAVSGKIDEVICSHLRMIPSIKYKVEMFDNLYAKICIN